jgi:hypothetical protein
LRLARICENATHPRCNCRCLGSAHGKARSKLPEFFEQLPTTDPHRIKPRSRQLPLPPPIGESA